MNVHIALAAGGYKYPFYTGVMRFFDMHQKEFNIKTISGCSVGNCSAMIHAGGYNKEHYISARTWLKSGELLKFDISNLFHKSIYRLDESFFEYYINYAAMMSRPYDVYFSYLHTSDNEVHYKNTKELGSRGEILNFLKGSCTVPILMKKEVGDEENGYIIDAGLKEPIPSRLLEKAPEEDLKIVVCPVNPFGRRKQFNIMSFAYDYLSSKLSSSILEGYRSEELQDDINYMNHFMEKNKERNYVYIYPEQNDRYFDPFEYKDEDPTRRYLDGYTSAKEVLSKYLNK